ncbi:MAG: primase-helicase zinc-binding domain-containing protein [Alphaproteobacteria bacterium]
MTMMKTVDRARGRWREVLPQLGIETRYLVNRHGPCPVCGGRDRFRFDDKDGSGSFFCNQCGPGLGMTLVMRAGNMDFATAAAAVDQIVGADAPVTPYKAPPKDDGAGGRRANIEKHLSEATAPQIARDYLASRGLSTFPETLKGHPAVPYYDNGNFAGRFPAMVAEITGPRGEIQSAHNVLTCSPLVPQ